MIALGRIGLCFLTAVLLAAVPACRPQADGVNVVLFVIDGTRQSETIDDSTHARIPHIWNDLRPQGSIIRSFRNDGKTLTNPGHASILSGTWQKIANDGSERPAEPTLFEYYRRYRRVPAEATHIVSGKPKLEALAWSTDPDYGESYGAAVTIAPEMDDSDVYATLIPILERDKPSLVMACFPTVDVEGHDGDWDRYLAAIARADSFALATWEFLQNDPHYRGKTYMFITNDHGRHVEPYGFQNHGCDCEGCRRLLFVALGPDIKKGYVAPPDVVYEQRDLCNTVARLLDFPVEHSEGRVIEQIFTASH